MAGIVKIYDSLKTEYYKAEIELKSVDKNLKKLTGKDFLEKNNVPINQINTKRLGNVKSPFEENKVRHLRPNDIMRKRKHSDGGNIFNRLDKKFADEERIAKKPSIPSTISVSAPVLKPKLDEAQNQNTDKKSVTRNRRMFGMIMGTLQKFQNEETQRKETTSKREEIEKKLDLAVAEEKEAVKKEKITLIKTKRDKQMQLRKIELKMDRVKIHQEWEKSNQNLGNFIQTKTKPYIFYTPNKLTPETEKRLKETKDKYRIILAERRAKVQKEILEIEELYTKQAEENDQIDHNDLIKKSENHCKEKISETFDHQDLDSSKNSRVSIKNNEEIEEGECENSNPEISNLSITINENSSRNNSFNEIEIKKESSIKVLNQNPCSENKNGFSLENVNDDDATELILDKNLDDKEFEPIYDE